MDKRETILKIILLQKWKIRLFTLSIPLSVNTSFIITKNLKIILQTI